MAGFKPKDTEYKCPTTSWRYCELETAWFWHLAPLDFAERDDEEKAEMVAFRYVRNLIESYHYEMADRAAKSKEKRK